MESADGKNMNKYPACKELRRTHDVHVYLYYQTLRNEPWPRHMSNHMMLLCHMVVGRDKLFFVSLFKAVKV